MKYYSVTTIADDRDNVTANITSTIESSSIPKAGFTATDKVDIYIDWFDSLKEALEFVKFVNMA
ncbi:hypothetical protein D3Z38_08930 [Clostridiales bacterium]|nr:hypothetical protein [Clostridiales bacterium]